MLRLKGIGLDAFEGKNEPPLAQIVGALGMRLDVGGIALSLSTEKDVIGDSMAISRFRGIPGEKIPSEDVFAFYMEGHKYVSCTDPSLVSKAPIKHPARVYKANEIQGKKLNNTYLVCFEEAMNGDYQDFVFLVENIKPETP